jgi:23S rRNA (pseudouridine1915-N3)-methyltransferase
MKVRVVALGHRMPDWIEAGWNEFARRTPREWDLSLVELKPEPRDRGKPVAALLALEAERIRHACRGTRMIALDERGGPWSTRMLADHLARWRDEGEDVAFVIGSADGLDPDLRRQAAACVSLSALTLPHALVRVILVEQLYRASALLAGHPYHRE